ncbi:MAG: hypothetical protein H7840_17325 [Alphaproteobacteria bacterium]
MEPQAPDWKGVMLETAREILRQGELYLSAQLTTALAADQRAVRLAGLFSAATSGLLAGGLALLTADSPVVELGTAALVMGVTMLVGLWFAVKATRPVDFYVVGNHPRQWWTEDDLHGPLSIALGQQGEHCQKAIDHNAEVLAGNGRSLRVALTLGLWTPVVGILTAAMAWGVTAGGAAAVVLAVGTKVSAFLGCPGS